jgi:hypothetical protein
LNKVTEAISLEADLLLKLKPLPEVEIFEFMKNLRGGTYFNMGMYSSIPVSRAYKQTIRIYKVLDLTAIVSGVDYENIGTTKDFRDATGEGPGKSWYDHTPGYEHKVGQKKSDPNSKYVLWDIKRGTGTCVRYYVVDIDTGAVTPVSKDDILNSDYLTQTEKNKLTPRPVVGIDLATGQAVENKTNWRTAAFDHIFWLNQAGKATQEYGVRFEEDLGLAEAFGDDIFMDAHAHVGTDLDAILSGEMIESIEKTLEEATDSDVFMDAHAGVKTKLDDVLSGRMEESVENIDNIKGVRTVTIHNDTNERVALDFNSFEEAAKHFDNLYANAVEENYAEEVLYPILLAAQNEEYDYIDEEGYAVIEQDATGIFDGALDDIYTNDVVEAREVSNKTSSLEESYRRTISRGAALIDNELFIDFD